MKSILRSLYNGNIIPWERRETDSEKRRAILQKIENEEQYFMAKMSLDDCQRFNALSDLHTQLSIVEEEDFFAYAFTIGISLAMDVMKEAEAVFND